MFFDYSRDEGFPTQHPRNHTPVTVDVLDVGFIFASVILAISFFISIINTRTEKNCYLYIRITVSILIGVMIMLGNFGQEWEVGEIHTRTHYKAGSGVEILAKVGLKIGLRSVNVTLKSIGDPHGLKNEKIDYNERFHWTWDQGRFGFGPYAGLLQREFREAQYRGAPLPILWVVDYFVIDGEGFRHGRFYRTAGWYAHIAMWSAFPCWLVANILFKSVIRYGGYMIGLAGIFQLCANFLWIIIRNPNPLVIPFSDATIYTHYGSSYWLTFVSGATCLLVSIMIIICEAFWHSQLHIFFGLDPITNIDEIYLTSEEELQQQQQQQASSNDLELRPTTQNRNTLDNRRSIIVRVKKNTRKSVMKRVTQQQAGPIYGNIGQQLDDLQEEDAEYDNVTLLQQQPNKRALPPLPPRSY